MNISANVLPLWGFQQSKLSFCSTSSTTRVHSTNFDNVGWVLGGGGARGIFQIGVASALSKAGMLPDVIIGNSAGSINALALYGGNITKAEQAWKKTEKKDIAELGLLRTLAKGGAIGYDKFLNLQLPSKMLKLSGVEHPTTIKSLLQNNQFLSFIDKYRPKIKPEGEKDPVELMIGITDINNGKWGAFTTKRLYEKLKENGTYKNSSLFKLTDSNAAQAVKTSCSIPVAFPAMPVGQSVYIDSCIGNNNLTTQGVNALCALNEEMDEGILFVVMLEPKENTNRQGKKRITPEKANIATIGKQSIDIVIHNEIMRDKETQELINRELDRWGVVNLIIQTTVENIKKTGTALRKKSREIAQLAKLLPEKTDQQKLQDLATEIRKLGNTSHIDARQIESFLENYEPFDGKKKIKVVLIQPDKMFNVTVLDFKSLKQNSNLIVQHGYDVTLKALLNAGLITKKHYKELKKEPVIPGYNIFETQKEKIVAFA